MSRRDPESLSIDKAIERYLRRRQSDATESSVKSFRYRLKIFRDWCSEIDAIETVSDLQRMDLDEFYEMRAAKASKTSLKNEMWTLKGFLGYLEDLGAVEDNIAEAVRIPELSQEDEVNETRLKAENAIEIIERYRNSDQNGCRRHAVLELAWFTGARQGALRGLDLRDVHFDKNYVEFHHRPETGTPLKNKRNGERPVALPDSVMRTLKRFVRDYRYDMHDDEGRQPFLASQRGRPGSNTVRSWCYLATIPCSHNACPHGRKREVCEFTRYSHCSKCPSSRSPHRVRTGSISWQLDQGFPPEIVAERVNASVEVIESHYDQSGPIERMERRRRSYVENLSLEV